MEQWVRFYLPSVVLIPIGLTFVVLAVYRVPTDTAVAVPLLVLGAGMVVLGGLATRLTDFTFGPQGVTGKLSPAEATMVAAAHLRLRQAAEDGELSAAELLRLEQAAAQSVATSRAPSRRFYVQRGAVQAIVPAEAIDPVEAGTTLAEALLKAAKVRRDQN